MRVSTGVTLAMAAASTLAALATFFVLRSQSQERARDQRIAALGANAGVRAERFDDSLRTLARDVRFLASLAVDPAFEPHALTATAPVQSQDFRSWSPAAKDHLAHAFAQSLRTNRHYLQVRLISAESEGHELVRVERSPGTDTICRTPDAALQPKGHRPYIPAALERAAGEVYFSDFELNREHGEVQNPRTPVVRAATPIFRPDDNTPLGVLVVNVDAAATLADVTQTREQGVIHYVVNARGDYICHPDAERAFEFEFGNAPTAESDFPSLAGTIGSGSAPRSVFDAERRELVTLRLLGADTLPAPLQLIGAVDLESISHGHTTDVGRLALLCALLVIVGLVPGFFLARFATRPLVRLSRAIENTDLEGGSFETPAGLSGEPATLAHALDAAFGALQRQHHRVAEWNQEITQFLHIASHDLQEPSRTISTFSAMLEKDCAPDLDEHGRTCIRYMSEASARMRELIKGLLEYGRLGRISERSRTDLGTVVEAALTDLSGLRQERGANVVVGDLPTMNIHPVEIRMLFQNLISNAIKFCPTDRQPEVHLAARPIDGGWEFTVDDNGMGIPKQHREEVFLIYQRLHARGEIEGTGIGLAHCRKIVKLHHGDIRIEDAPTHGARFRFSLMETAQ